MHRLITLDLIRSYEKTWGVCPFDFENKDLQGEKEVIDRMRDFVIRHPSCLERHCPPGHITASAMVADLDRGMALLTLHAKLGIWLQLGGHVEGDGNIPEAALREAVEESGRTEVNFFPYEKSLFNCLTDSTCAIPFDLDINFIPARKSEPEHHHFDIRFLCQMDSTLPLAISEESTDLRWVTIEEGKRLAPTKSMLRQFAKLEKVIASTRG